MPMYFIGLGLGDEKDVTIKGKEAIERSSRVYLEAYTSVLGGGGGASGLNKENMEQFYGREIVVADRQMVEERADELMPTGPTDDVAFLVIGDPFGATTHTDLMMRAKQAGIEVLVIHNASIMNAVGCCGLQLYTYGQSVSICFFRGPGTFWPEENSWRPDSFYPKVAVNRAEGLHTLCLLDIKVKEPNLEALARGKMVYEPPRYMTINTCIEEMLEVEKKHVAAGTGGAYDTDTLCVGVACVGCDNQKIVAGTMKQLLDVDFGPPLHSMVMCGQLHECELEVLNAYRLEGTPPLTASETSPPSRPAASGHGAPSLAGASGAIAGCNDAAALRALIMQATDRLVGLSHQAQSGGDPAVELGATEPKAARIHYLPALHVAKPAPGAVVKPRDCLTVGGAEIAFEGSGDAVNVFLDDLGTDSDD